MNNTLKVLIVDDEPELRTSIQSILKAHFKSSSEDIDFSEASDGEEALRKFAASPKDLILMDVRMPKLSGLEALNKIKEVSPQTFIVMMTAHGNLPDAVQAIKDGAYDYLEKPLQPTQLIEIVEKALEARSLISELTISNPILDDDIESSLIGSSDKMKEIFFLIQKLCEVDTTVLIRGENGTGKELVAQAIHYNSPRKKGEFVAINCGAIPENLMESELFGHEKGAFTGAHERKIGKFQLATEGTLFLDEIGELPPDMQVKLLRVIQEKTFSPVGSNRVLKTNARILSATNRNLEKMIEEGLFREDLFFRLNVMPIFLPPLRERRADVLSLSRHFLKKLSHKYQKNISDLSEEVLQKFESYSWPGNIRELENALERAFVLENSSTIHLGNLPDSLLQDSDSLSIQSELEGELNFESFKEKSEKEFIISALKANKGRINKTVAHANIPKNTLLRKIKKYNINVKDFQ